MHNPTNSPLEKYREVFNELFEKCKIKYKSGFETTHANVYYTLDEDGKALFNFELQIKKRNNDKNNGDNFYVVIPVIKSFKGGNIIDDQKIHVLSVECIGKNNEEVNFNTPALYNPSETKIKTAQSTNLELEAGVLEISFKNSIKSEPFNLIVSFQIERFAIEEGNYKTNWIINLFNIKRFNILWYFGFIMNSSTNRTAKIEIEHPTRGSLKVGKNILIYPDNNKLGYAQHGRKFICGIHSGNNKQGATPVSMTCYFEYSYMPEWAVITISVIPFGFITLFLHIFYEQVKDSFLGFFNSPWCYIWDFSYLFLYVGLTYFFAYRLANYIRKNCS